MTDRLTESRWITKREYAEMLDMSERTVDRWVKRGLLPKPYKAGSSKQARCRWLRQTVIDHEKRNGGAV